MGIQGGKTKVIQITINMAFPNFQVLDFSISMFSTYFYEYNLYMKFAVNRHRSRTELKDRAVASQSISGRAFHA